MKIDTEYTDRIVCPYCGHKQIYDFESISDAHIFKKHECERCEKVFDYETHHSISFSSYPKEDKI